MPRRVRRSGRYRMITGPARDIAEDNLHEAKRNVTVRCAVRRMVLTFLVGVPVCYLRYRPEPQSTSHARCPVEPFALAASSISARCRAMRTFRENGLRAAHTGMCADAFWRVAKAGTKKTVEVRNVGQASLQCHGQTKKLLGLLRTVGDGLCANNLYPGPVYGNCIL
jgi:hypothetical protein